jgi:hypothetical protein
MPKLERQLPRLVALIGAIRQQRQALRHRPEIA